ncbi:acyl-CoA dehydrogenase family protein [Kyrpidia tusciae]|uniref:Acyl-CoA dehydrogenase domain protein n=1 Tax=Kyrpidia tusciae (strain DSM 2912 / NBRC 15312 / T2) TaxID=562970 RepID=D5WXV3_KYRT2|nr:acyl-CoA dehydrogenase family protein [Kyrpidia tusciae]ADG06012.1 acyl-CoA dehydrogenase domain protein [Kyrpidia tusciae DSM 2912]
MPKFTLETVRLPETTEELRAEVRRFLQMEEENGGFIPACDAWLGGFSPSFSEELGKRGWIGMTWPKRYGGHERSEMERYVVIEELLAAGAPVAAHWVADRQMGPLLLRYGSEEQKERFLPLMAQGKSYWAIGMSEPNAGSDLAAVQAKLTPDGEGWRLSGQKIWSSGAHQCHYMMTLCRNGPSGSDRHAGLSNVIVDLHDPHVEVRPIYLLDGGHHFNEVFFHDVYIPPSMVIGEAGDGWRQVTEELAYERSGPERFLTTFPLLRVLVQKAASLQDDFARRDVAVLVAELASLRELSLSVAGILNSGGNPVTEAALVKDAGTRFERKVTEIAERLADLPPVQEGADPFLILLAQAMLHGPGFTIRGGTNEILRGIVARGLGLR